MKNIVWIISAIAIMLLGYVSQRYLFDTHAYHIHADFAVFIDGTKMDFAHDGYMTSTDICATDYNSKHTHLHDENGEVIHIHQEGQTVSDFFTSIGFALTDESLVSETDVTYTNNTSKKWQFFVNGVATSSLQGYVFNDLDKILLSYGNAKTQYIEKELGEVSHNACIYSEKCPKPEGVVLPTERCGTSE
ncbi:MAG: hypothetical protein AAB447_03220 [Patescibacteria group bacterium]